MRHRKKPEWWKNSHGLGIWFRDHLPSLCWGSSSLEELWLAPLMVGCGPSAVTCFWGCSFWSEGMWMTDLFPAGVFLFSVKNLIWIKIALQFQQQHFTEGSSWTPCLLGRVKWQGREEKRGDVLCLGDNNAKLSHHQNIAAVLAEYLYSARDKVGRSTAAMTFCRLHGADVRMALRTPKPLCYISYT